MQERLPLLIFLMVCLMTVAYSTIGIYTPAMPAIAAHFGASAGEVQLTFSAYLIAFSFGQLIYGPLSDRHGRRPAILVGLVIYVIGSALSALAVSIEMLIVVRAIQALGGCAGPVLARAIMRDLFDRDEGARLMAFVAMVMGVAPAFAPVFGGYLQVVFGWESIFWVLTVVGAVVLILFIFLLRETHTGGSRAVGGGVLAMLMVYPRLMRSRLFIGYTLNAGFAMATIFVYIASAPFVLIELLDIPPDLYGWYTLIPTLFNLAGAFVASRYTVRMGGARMMLYGSIVVFVGAMIMVAFAVVGHLSVFTVVSPMAIVAFGLANVFPSAAQGAVSVAPRQAGAASSLNGFLTMLIASLAVVVVGVLPPGSQMPMAAVVGAMGVLTILSLLLTREESHVEAV
jgi:DHA1 family bicyclomycin/chloramphenicol resistance-like MFS transporter